MKELLAWVKLLVIIFSFSKAEGYNPVTEQWEEEKRLEKELTQKGSQHSNKLHLWEDCYYYVIILCL